MSNIIITGCSRGIGYELAQKFAFEGNRVLALSRNEKPIKALNNPNIVTFPFDICDARNIDFLVDYLKREWKSVDILINNAGKLLNKPFLETTVSDFEDIYNVNVFGVAELTRRVLPFMSSSGHVVTVSSMGGVQGSAKFPGLAAYSSSKAAVITLTELWAEEFKTTGPSFNVLALGAVQTEMLEEAFPGYKAQLTAEEMAEYIRYFALNGQKLYNGKLMQVSKSTP